MKRMIFIALTCAISISAAQPDYFPLQTGNRWVLQTSEGTPELLSIEVVRSRGREFRSFNRLPRVDRHGNVRKFCNDCGSKLVDTDPMPACPRCKRPAQSSRQTFCNGCGQDFRTLRFVAAELEVKAENMKITGPGPKDFEFYIPLLAHPPKLTSLPPGAILGGINVDADDQSVTFFLIAPRPDPRPLKSPVKDFEDCTRPFQRLLQVGKDGRDV